MKNRILIFIMVCITALGCTACSAENSAESNGNISVTINDSAVIFDQEPIIENGRTLVPVRAIFEALGASVDWDDATQTVTSKRGDINVVLTIGSDIMSKNGKDIAIDVPAQTVNDRTLVPARAVAEAFGCNVDWDDSTQTVTINETENTSAEINLNHTYTTQYATLYPTLYPQYAFDYSDNWLIASERPLEASRFIREDVVLKNDRGVAIHYMDWGDNEFKPNDWSGGKFMSQYEVSKVADSQLEFVRDSCTLEDYSEGYLEEQTIYVEPESLDDFIVGKFVTTGELYLDSGNTEYTPVNSLYEQYAVMPKTNTGTQECRGMAGFYDLIAFKYREPKAGCVFHAYAPDGVFTDEERAEVIAILSSFRALGTR